MEEEAKKKKEEARIAEDKARIAKAKAKSDIMKSELQQSMIKKKKALEKIGKTFDSQRAFFRSKFRDMTPEELKIRDAKKEPKKKTVIESEEETNLNDIISMKLQHLIYITPTNKISNILSKMNFKGKLKSNKILLSQQILQNFNTIEKMKELILKLEDK